jgi:hypothetical protein
MELQKKILSVRFCNHTSLKMKFFQINMMALFIMAMCFSRSWADDTGWKKIGESNGIVGYTRPSTKSSVDQMKGVGIIEAPVAVIEALLRDAPAGTEYMYKCKESSIVNTPELKNTTDSKHFYNVTSMPYPVSDRDVVGKGEWSIDKATGTLFFHAEGIKSDYKMDKKKVRMPILIADYILVPKGPDKTEVTYTALADPGGNLPSFVVNLLTKNLSIQTIAGMREMVKKDKYKNVKSVVTTTPH